MGGMISAPAMAGIMGQKTNQGTFVSFSAEQVDLIVAIADVIIPSTKTPGAKTAGAEKYILNVVQDCYTKAEQDTFYEGLMKLDADCKKKAGKGFVQATDVQKKEALTACMLEGDVARKTKKGVTPFFFMIKELATVGYFTSKIGATEALDYLPIPVKFDVCMPLDPKQKTWAL
jgi:hypothetical protein